MVDALDEQPDLTAIELFYYDAFNFISPMRNTGMGIGAIPIDAYVQYYNVFGAPNSLAFFCEVIREVDGRVINDKHKKEQDEKKRKHK